MKNTRIFYQGELSEQAEVNLPTPASHHILNVLRLPLGAQVTVFNGQGQEYLATITAASKKTATLHIEKQQKILNESPLALELAQGISRGERMDYVVQKAVELGVSAITPLFTERCGVKLNADRLKKRVAHWQGVIISACEQSGRQIIPVLNIPQNVTSWLREKRSGLKLVCNPLAPPEKYVETVERVTLLVGPEGGFTADEIQLAVQQGFLGFKMGPRILRTETATVVALTIAQSRWGDMKN